MAYFSITQDHVDQFHHDGYLYVPDLFSAEEMDLVIQASTAGNVLEDHALEREDDSGKISKLTVWNHPGDDIFGRIARCDRIVNTMERVLDDEVYHWHSKMMIKEPEVGGAWVWHQDYGYWYEFGCLFPDMASCMVAVNRASRENGCLQVLKGSHKLGRIRPMKVGNQIGCDPERVEQADKQFELVYCEMEPGSGLFFHSNTLHRSAANESQDGRWVLICCYNTKHNSPFGESRHPEYTPIKRIADRDVAEAGAGLDSERVYSNFNPPSPKSQA